MVNLVYCQADAYINFENITTIVDYIFMFL